MKSLVTVVVSTQQRQARLRECLLALAQQTLPFSQFDVIIVDRFLSRSTALLVQAVAQETGLTIRYVRQRHNGNQAAAYNRGWQLANSMFVAFTCDRYVPQPTWLTATLPLLRQGAGVVVGQVRTPSLTKLASASIGANLICRRSLLLNLGGFDERIGYPLDAKTRWLKGLKKTDVPVVDCPDAIVICPDPAWLVTVRSMLSRVAVAFTTSLFFSYPSTYERCKTSDTTPGSDRLSGRSQQLHLASLSERRKKDAG